MTPGRHPKNAINAALRELDLEYFEVVGVHRGHTWGIVRCRFCSSWRSIPSTPRVPEDAARRISQFARAHRH